jgi:hypothetical protein
MQFPDSFGDLLSSPVFIISLVVVLVVVVLYFAKKKMVGPADRSPIQKVRHMHSAIKKGNQPDIPVTRSRQDITSELFESKMNKIGLEPASEAGFIPVSTGDFADYMIEHGVDPDTMRAILDDLPTLKREEMFDVVEAATEMRDVDFTNREVEEAKKLALNEWKRQHRK